MYLYRRVFVMVVWFSIKEAKMNKFEIVAYTRIISVGKNI